MAISGIKKVVIKKDNLPPIGPDNNYSFRYRIISSDKNRTSHWSPIYSVIAPQAENVDGSVEISQKGVQVYWTDPENGNDKEAYDIFVSFDDAEYFHHGEAFSHGYSFLNPGAVKVNIIIQLQGIKKVLNPALQIFEGTDTLVV
jgi:hypothetical protein